MIFDGPVLAWLILAMLPIILPIFLAVILKQLLPVQGGCLPLVGLLAFGLACAAGIIYYLNSEGAVLKGEVLLKREFLVYHLDGSWNLKTTAQISYRPSETAPPVSITLDLMPTRFDEINQGDFVDLRCPSKPGLLQIIRLDDQKVFSQIWYWLTNQPFLFWFISGMLAVLCIRFMFQTTLPTLFFLSGLVTVGAWWMANVGIPWWQQTATLFGSLNSISATVREVHPPYLGTGLQGWLSTTLYRPTDLILVDIIAVGHPEPILSVDEVDLGSSTLRPGQTVTAEYSARNPRLTIVPDATRSYIWKNGLINSFLAGLVLLAIAKLAQIIRGKTQKTSDAKAPRRRRQTPAG